MTVQDPTTLRIGTNPSTLLRSILATLRGLYTKGSTFSEPLLALGMGRLRLISTATASNDATVDFTLDGNHDRYLLSGVAVVPATDAVDAWARVSIAGTYQTANYRWARFNSYDTPSDATLGSTSDAKITIHTGIGSAAGECIEFLLWIGGPSNTALHKHVFGTFAADDQSGAQGGGFFTGSYRGATSAIDGIRFMFSSGNVESGEFSLYGLGNVTS